MIDLKGMSHEQLVKVTSMSYDFNQLKNILEYIREEELASGDKGDAEYISMIDRVLPREA